MKDLRSFLQLATEARKVTRITRPVHPDTEAGALLREFERHRTVGVIEHVTGREGRRGPERAVLGERRLGRTGRDRRLGREDAGTGVVRRGAGSAFHGEASRRDSLTPTCARFR